MDAQRRQTARAEKRTRHPAPARKQSKAGVSVPEAVPAKPKTRSRHYRRAQYDRGAETRARLIEAALDVFGRLGLEGATTREIGKQAGVNLAAIVYHFGG